MTTESDGPSIPDETAETIFDRQLAEEKFEYFLGVVHAVRFATADLGEENQRELLARRRHNSTVRARTAARVAGGLTLSGRMPRYRR